jgi:hypothetical protein
MLHLQNVVAAERMSSGHRKEKTRLANHTTIACSDGCGAGRGQRGGLGLWDILGQNRSTKVHTV